CESPRVVERKHLPSIASCLRASPIRFGLRIRLMLLIGAIDERHASQPPERLATLSLRKRHRKSLTALAIISVRIAKILLGGLRVADCALSSLKSVICG